MRTHAKAPSAGSTEHRASRLGRFFRGAFATRGASGDARGSGARKGAHFAFPAALVAALALLAFAAAPAGAVTTRQFVEIFGSAEEQAFRFPKSLAFDQGAGALMVATETPASGENPSSNDGRISRFDEDGNPVNFSALGTSILDGKKGPGEKPCAEEPASCDVVPQGKLAFSNSFNEGIAIDESGGATDGNIYVAQPEFRTMQIFAADGHYLGQIGGFEVGGVAVDPSGNLYISDALGGVNKYDPSANPPVSGDLLTTFTTIVEPYNLVAGAGPTAGWIFVFAEGGGYKLDATTGAIDYKYFSTPISAQAVDPVSGHLFVGKGNIFDPASELFEFDVSDPLGAVKLTEAHPNHFGGIAVNGGKDLLYVSHSDPSPEDGKVEVFGPAPKVPRVETGTVSNLTGTNATLNATVNPRELEVESCVFEWGGTSEPYEHTTPCAETSAQIGEGNAPVPVHADISGLTGGGTYHFRIVAANANGANEGQDKVFFTTAPPLISEEAVQTASRTEAMLIFKVNPRNFATTYHLEYGKAGQPYELSTNERGVGADGTDHALTFTLEGLTPGTAYHWRIVASNLDPAFPGTGVTNGAEQKFHTHGSLALNTSCPNQAFRTGSAATLPDCRAYEMVSPVDKNGGDIAAFLGFGAGEFKARAAFDQAALDGNKLTYSAGTPFGDTIAGRNSNQYMATRGAGGWSTHSLNAPGGPVVEEPAAVSFPLDPAYTLFTPDLSEAWMQDARIQPLTADAIEGMPNYYRRSNLAESYEALTNEEPAARPAGLFAYEYLFWPRGHSSDYSDVLFETKAPMTPDAFPTPKKVSQTYASIDGGLHLVSVRPDGSALPGDSGGHALSADGSRAFWSARGSDLFYESSGPLYLRLNPSQPQSSQALGGASGNGDLIAGSNEVTGVDTASGAFAVGQEIISGTQVTSSPDFLPNGTTITAVGPSSLTLSAVATETAFDKPLSAWSECTEPDKACTIPLSRSVPGGLAAEFQFASADGSKALFTAGGVLYEFDVLTRTATPIADESPGVVGGSKDGSRVYFFSREDLAAGATVGEPNLYLNQGGANTFVATVTQADVDGSPGRMISLVPQKRATRISPDGSHLLFMSKSKALAEQVADYDNTDAVSGEADHEVYLYEVGGELRCVSCNPSGARPRGQQMQASFDVAESKFKTNTWAAAWIPGWEHDLLAQRAMSDDGSRIFFNAFDALVPGDTNGTQDVYQWELPGTGDCTLATTTYSEQNGGCVSLISSGQSPQTSEFIDASVDGRDVFFTTASSLLPQDPGLVDMYDARVEGGFPQPPAAAAICEGEACQGAPTPPNDPTPASAAYNGPGNLNEAAAKKKKSKKHKKKNKHKKKAKKKGGKAKRHAANNSTRRNG